ncbi:response regulator, partial [Candidatus Roizmanbacteria bacterium]|nr:response regulator [Candidatus Roizmanbacteria bacterium]
MMKILIIDDDVFFQKFYLEKLSEKGFQVEVASDGDQGLAKMKLSKPDLILLDIIMPKKDGFEFLQAMRQDPLFKQIPVIVFSTLGQPTDVDKAKSLGAVDYVNKGFFDFENLVAKIN